MTFLYEKMGVVDFSTSKDLRFLLFLFLFFLREYHLLRLFPNAKIIVDQLSIRKDYL